MKDVSLTLRKQYYSLLNENVILNGSVVPVYDSVPSSANFPFIVLDTVTELDNDDKDSFGVEFVQTIDIVTGYNNGSHGGKKDSDEIANQVKNLIKPNKNTDVFDLSPDFTNIIVIFERGNTITEQTDTHYIIRRILDFKHIIQEN